MLIKEVQQLRGQALFEALDRENDSGMLTEDLVAIVQEHRAGQWQSVTGEELSRLLEGVRGKV